MLLAAAYQRLGRADDALALAKGKALRPASTIANVTPPLDNASPVFIAASEAVTRTLVTLGCRGMKGPRLHDPAPSNDAVKGRLLARCLA